MNARCCVAKLKSVKNTGRCEGPYGVVKLPLMLVYVVATSEGASAYHYTRHMVMLYRTPVSQEPTAFDARGEPGQRTCQTDHNAGGVTCMQPIGPVDGCGTLAGQQEHPCPMPSRTTPGHRHAGPLEHIFITSKGSSAGRYSKRYVLRLIFARIPAENRYAGELHTSISTPDAFSEELDVMERLLRHDIQVGPSSSHIFNCKVLPILLSL